MYTIVLPVLNEYENLKKLLPILLHPKCEVIVCDNGSTDGSVEVVQAALPNFNIRLLEGTGTVTAAILRGLEAASCDKIVVMDADFSHSPGTVRWLASELEEHDIVVGSRSVPGGSTGDSFRNRVVSWGLNLLSWGLAPYIKDRVSGFWGIRKALASVPIRDTVKPMLEYLVRANPTSVVEVPYTFRPRIRGSSKLGKPILKAFTDVLRLYAHKYQRLLKFCIVGGIGSSIYLGCLAFFTEVVGFWYFFSALLGIVVATIWNFGMNRNWTFSQSGDSSECNYEWNAWYRGNPLQKWWKRKIGRITKEMLGSPSRLLDVGCGSSPVINLFHCERVGVDRSQEKLDFIGGYSTAEFQQVDLDVGKWPNWRAFGGVICNNVLEHLRDPEPTVRNISNSLVEGGLAVLTVPNLDNPLTRLVEWLYRKVMSGGYADEHFFEFTPGSLDSMCSRYGLQLVERKSVLTDMVCLYVKV